MSYYGEKCADECTFEYNEDKQRGVCAIKAEFIVENHVRQLAKECLTEADKLKLASASNNVENETSTDEPPDKKSKGEDKKEKLKGQNKARPPTFKAPREANLCPWMVDQAVNEPDKKCQNKRCTFMHDRAEYMKIKPIDIREECYLFNVTGRCPRGVACRMGSKHLTADGLNIVDKQKFEEYKRKPLTTKNALPKDLQNRLRKHQFNFSRAEKIVKANDASKKKKDSKQNENIKVGKKEVTEDAKGEENPETRGQSENTKADVTNGINSDVTKNDVESRESESQQKNSSQNPKVDNENTVGTPSLEEKGTTVTVSNSPMESETELKIGPVLDYDIIKQLPSEKKKIDWKDKLLLSPLTTVGNLPFRRICKEYGADLTCGEMALAPKILKGAHEEWALVKRHESENVFGVQLCGNNPGVLARCAQLLEQEVDVDFVDLNLGCPIDLIYRQGGGSGMLNRLNVLETVIKSVSQVLNVPLTIKTRMGVYMDKPVAHNLAPKFRDWGASMITVHGRSREQRYTKMADWQYIEKCAQAARPIPIYGNGDILSFEDYKQARANCPTIQGITIGRGALIKPWIFTEIKEQRLTDVPSCERFDILKKYANYGLEHWGSDTRGVETTRRFMLEWISFLHRYIPIGILERPPQRINDRPPYFRGRDDLETLMSSSNCADWIKISEMLLGKVPEGFHFLPKHKANSWK